MKSKKGCILSIFLVLFIFGVTIPLFMTNHKKIKADTISDLTDTTWLLNDTVVFDPYSDNSHWYFINFTSNNNSFSILYFQNVDEDYDEFYLEYRLTNNNYVDVYYGGYNPNYEMNVINSSYQEITITGGTDVTNSNLISWLQNNATQQGIAPVGTEITHKYWASYLDINLSNNEVIGDNNISYKVLLNTYTDNYNDETLTGLTFTGLISNDNHSYIISIDGSITTILYQSDTSTIDNPMLLEFTLGDYIDSDLYDLMEDTGVWFDDARAYMAGTSFGSIYGFNRGIAYGEANATQYTSLVTNILNGLGNILSIQVFPNITIGLIIGLPLLLGVFIIIIKILRG